MIASSYTMRMYCENCLTSFMHKFPVGTRVTSVECPNCMVTMSHAIEAIPRKSMIQVMRGKE